MSLKRLAVNLISLKRLAVNLISLRRLAANLAVLVLIATSQPVILAQLGTRSASSISTQVDSSPAPLSLEEAFPFYVSATSPGRLRVNWNLAEGHYLYRHAFNFSMKQTVDGESLAIDYSLPEGLEKSDEFFGDIVAYYGQVAADLAFPTVPGPDSILIIEYQGCADWGFCYPPQKTEYKIAP